MCADSYVLTIVHCGPAQVTYMALAWRKQKLGAAYYNTQTCVLSVMPDTAEDAGFGITQQRMLCKHTGPHWSCPDNTEQTWPV